MQRGRAESSPSRQRSCAASRHNQVGQASACRQAEGLSRMEQPTTTCQRWSVSGRR